MVRGFKVTVRGKTYTVTLPGGRKITGEGESAQDALAKGNAAGAEAPENTGETVYGNCGSCGAGGSVGTCDACGGTVA